MEKMVLISTEASSPRITHKAKSSTPLARILNLAFAPILILAHVRLQVQPVRRALDSHSLIPILSLAPSYPPVHSRTQSLTPTLHPHARRARPWLICLKGTPTTKCTLQNLSLTA